MNRGCLFLDLRWLFLRWLHLKQVKELLVFSFFSRQALFKLIDNLSHPYFRILLWVWHESICDSLHLFISEVHQVPTVNLLIFSRVKNIVKDWYCVGRLILCKMLVVVVMGGLLNQGNWRKLRVFRINLHMNFESILKINLREIITYLLSLVKLESQESLNLCIIFNPRKRAGLYYFWLDDFNICGFDPQYALDSDVVTFSNHELELSL